MSIPRVSAFEAVMFNRLPEAPLDPDAPEHDTDTPFSTVFLATSPEQAVLDAWRWVRFMHALTDHTRLIAVRVYHKTISAIGPDGASGSLTGGIIHAWDHRQGLPGGDGQPAPQPQPSKADVKAAKRRASQA